MLGAPAKAAPGPATRREIAARAAIRACAARGAAPAGGFAVRAAGDAVAGFSVQLAAFADDKGANALANKLKKAGYPAYTEPLDDQQGHAVARARRPLSFARGGRGRRGTS